MLVIWMFVYSIAITNDSASYLHTFGVTEGLLSTVPFMVWSYSHSGGNLFTRREIVIQNFDRHGADQLLVVAALGVSMVGMRICITSVRCRRWGCW